MYVHVVKIIHVHVLQIIIHVHVTIDIHAQQYVLCNI